VPDPSGTPHPHGKSRGDRECRARERRDRAALEGILEEEPTAREERAYTNEQQAARCEPLLEVWG
jgi:hypothetical protein